MATSQSNTETTSVLKLLGKAKNMPHLMDQVLSHLSLKDLKMLSRVSKLMKSWVKEVYDKRSLETALRFIDNYRGDLSETDRQGRSLLWQASCRGDVDLMVLLMDNGADVAKKDICGYTPLYIAIHNTHIEAVKVLLEAGGITNSLDLEKALEWAASTGQIEIASYLLSRGAVATQMTLNYACRAGNIEMTQMMLANVNAPKITEALRWATKAGCLDLVKFFVQHFGVHHIKIAQQEKHFPPFFNAIHYGRMNVFEYFLTLFPIEELIKLDVNGKSALWVAAACDKVEMLELLLSKGADINGTRRNPLDIAVYMHHEEVIERLLRNGVSVNPTVLHMAVKRCDLITIKMLVELGKADINAKNESGQTAFEVAFQDNQHDVVQYFNSVLGDISTVTCVI